MKTIESKQYSLNLRDYVKGFLIAAITAIVTGCGQMIEIYLTSPTFSIDKVSVVLVIKTGLGGGVAYLIKNFLTPTQTVVKAPISEIEITKKDPDQTEIQQN